MFIVEKETNDRITGTYPVTRFQSQIQQIEKYYKEKAKAYKGKGDKKTFT